MTIRSQYLAGVLSPSGLLTICARLAPLVKSFNPEAIAFCGMSGAIVGPTLAWQTSRQMLLVRKNTDESHSFFGVEGNLDVKTYVIVDDFVANGDTITNIITRIRKYSDAKCVGIIMYSQENINTLKLVANKVEIPYQYLIPPAIRSFKKS